MNTETEPKIGLTYAEINARKFAEQLALVAALVGLDEAGSAEEINHHLRTRQHLGETAVNQ